MIQKPLSCKIKKSDVQFDYENVIIKYTDGYESEIKKMISIIYDEIGDIWDEMWTWDDVIDRFETAVDKTASFHNVNTDVLYNYIDKEVDAQLGV